MRDGRDATHCQNRPDLVAPYAVECRALYSEVSGTVERASWALTIVRKLAFDVLGCIDCVQDLQVISGHVNVAKRKILKFQSL